MSLYPAIIKVEIIVLFIPCMEPIIKKLIIIHDTYEQSSLEKRIKIIIYSLRVYI